MPKKSYTVALAESLSVAESGAAARRWHPSLAESVHFVETLSVVLRALVHYQVTWSLNSQLVAKPYQLGEWWTNWSENLSAVEIHQEMLHEGFTIGEGLSHRVRFSHALTDSLTVR